MSIRTIHSCMTVSEKCTGLYVQLEKILGGIIAVDLLYRMSDC